MLLLVLLVCCSAAVLGQLGESQSADELDLADLDFGMVGRLCFYACLFFGCCFSAVLTGGFFLSAGVTQSPAAGESHLSQGEATPARPRRVQRVMFCCSAFAGDQASDAGAVHQDHHHVALRLHRGLLRDAQPAHRRLRGRLPVPDARQRLRLQLHHVRGEKEAKEQTKGCSDILEQICKFGSADGDVTTNEVDLKPLEI